MKDMLLIGCPVRSRAWAMPTWFAAIERATERVAITPQYVFVLDPRDPTKEVIDLECVTRSRRVTYVFENEEEFTDKRRWNSSRYHRMIYLRNLLLGKVREISPDLFLSLDSDIFVHPDCLVKLLATITRFDAVGGKLHMTPSDLRAPSYANLPPPPASTLIRPNCSDVMEVDCIMALKLMRPTAYNIDYEYHEHGEDIGWSIACRRAGLRLAWDGRLCNKHAMSPGAVTTVDPRCGY